MFKQNRGTNSLKHNDEWYKSTFTRNKGDHHSKSIFTHNIELTYLEIKIMILETNDIVFQCNTSFWKINSCIMVISASTVCSNKIKERITWNIMMSVLTLHWHLPKESITQSLYLHISKELHGNHNHHSRDKRPCLSM